MCRVLIVARFIPQLEMLFKSQKENEIERPDREWSDARSEHHVKQ